MSFRNFRVYVSECVCVCVCLCVCERERERKWGRAYCGLRVYHSLHQQQLFFVKKNSNKATGTQAASLSLKMYTRPSPQAKWNIVHGIESSGRKVVPRTQSTRKIYEWYWHSWNRLSVVRIFNKVADECYKASSGHWQNIALMKNSSNYDDSSLDMKAFDSWRIKHQLDVTCYFILLLMYSTCFGH